MALVFGKYFYFQGISINYKLIFVKAVSGMDEGRNFEKLGYESLQKNNIEDAKSNFLEALKHMEKAGDDTGQA
ncbi:MAG: hypothetical protein HOI59_00575, partial [Nitrospina sp.]|nr:hypothetical protein [Nitrospina sp.]